MEGITKLRLALVMCLVVSAQGRVAQAQAHTHPHEDIIQSVCERTPNKELCVKTLMITRPHHAKPEVKDLAVIFMTQASKNASEIIQELKELIENDTLHPKVQQGLSDCKDMLLDAEDQLQIAVAAVLRKEAHDAQKWLQVALDATSICTASLRGQEEYILAKNTDFRQLCLVAFALCKDIANAGA